MTYYEDHREEIKERSRQWTKDNPELKHQQNMAYSEKKNEWVKNNPLKREITLKKYNKSHRIEINERNRRRRKELKDKLYKILGGYICIKCGYSKEMGLTIDHINNDGGEDRKKGLTRDKFYRFYVSQPELAKKKLQVFCSNCNSIKEHERKQSTLI